MVAVFIVPFKSPEKVVNVAVPPLVILLVPMFIAPAIVPPASGKKGPPIGPCKSATVHFLSVFESLISLNQTKSPEAGVAEDKNSIALLAPVVNIPSVPVVVIVPPVNPLFVATEVTVPVVGVVHVLTVAAPPPDVNT